MKVDAFDFDLPSELIALRPLERREEARLLCVRPEAPEPFVDARIGDLPQLLEPGDALVFNDTRVIPARLTGRRIGRSESGARIEATLLQPVGEGVWTAFARPIRKLKAGELVRFARSGEPDDTDTLDARITEVGVGGEVVLDFAMPTARVLERLETVGAMPLPPYIAARRPPDAQDRADYQTMFAAEPGAVASPTAALHFTDALMGHLKARGLSVHMLTLHVGAGTFQPVKSEDTAGHRMHAEWARLGSGTAAELDKTRRRGGRIVAVGTTSLRTLESAVGPSGALSGFEGATDLFITPGYRFRAVDLLMTNFHLPRSTLFMLVAAFSGLETMRAAYAHAIAERYRFYSYGDACLLAPQGRRP